MAKRLTMTWFEALQQLTAWRRAAALDEREIVAQALAEGASYGEIGAALGITRQTAHERFASLAPTSGVKGSKDAQSSRSDDAAKDDSNDD